MSEHQFDSSTVQRWQAAAARARHEWDQWRSVNDRASPAANAALLDLKRTLAETVSKKVAEWAVTHWLITWEPIEECVRQELAEQRPWPSPASKRIGGMTAPSS